MPGHRAPQGLSPPLLPLPSAPASASSTAPAPSHHAAWGGILGHSSCTHTGPAGRGPQARKGGQCHGQVAQGNEAHGEWAEPWLASTSSREYHP